MTADDTTDSLFAAELDADILGDSNWHDLRLIHESQKGWCVLYSCLHRGHRVVIKALKEQYRGSEVHRRLLEKEYEIGHGMNHENVATVMWMEDVPGLGLSILMEYVDGQTLGSYLASRPELKVDEQLRIVDQLCSAVGYLHSRQTVHCDLKPSNVMLTFNGSFVKLIDFGTSRGFGFEKLDFPGGTRGFTAPENLHGDSPEASPRTDVYSIGRLIGLMDRRGTFSSVVARLTAEDPAQRPAHVAEIPQMMRRVVSRRLWRRRLAWAAGLMGAVVGVVIAWLLLAGEDEALRPAEAPVGPVDDSALIVRPAEVFSTDEEATTGDITDDKPLPMAESETGLDKRAGEAQTAPAVAADESLPLDAQLYQRALQAAEHRWRDNLNMIDTMTSARTAQLLNVDHWRWLAKQDVRRWLESKLLPGNPRIESLLVDAEKAIREYGEDPNRLSIRHQHWARAIKRRPELSGTATVITRIDRATDRYYKDSLLEDGTWLKQAGSLTPRPRY